MIKKEDSITQLFDAAANKYGCRQCIKGACHLIDEDVILQDPQMLVWDVKSMGPVDFHLLVHSMTACGRQKSVLAGVEVVP